METNVVWQYAIACACAVLGLYGLASGLKAGRSSDFSGIKIRRSENPISYWISIVINGVVGVGGVLVLIYKLLH